MSIEFDPDKDAINRRKHGVSLADAALMEFDTAIFEPDRRYADSEDRIQALGLIGDRLHMLVSPCAAMSCGSISLRKANARERKRYDEQA